MGLEPAADIDRLADAAARALKMGEGAAGRPAPAGIWRDLPGLGAWLARIRPRFTDPSPAATKAAEWMLDNEFQLTRAIRQLKADLPAAFYNRLPALPGRGRPPRVLLFAHHFLDAVHCQVSEPNVIRFLSQAGRNETVCLAELWAFPAMLRLACLETLVSAICDLFPGLAPPAKISAFCPKGTGQDATERISRAICALAEIAVLPWPRIVEKTSKIEEVLRGDPAGIHARTDFETRDANRRAVEEIARRSEVSEVDVARRAIRRAEAAAGDFRKGHAGWWLIGDGRPLLEAEAGARPAFRTRMARRARARARPLYAAALTAFGLLGLLVPLLPLALWGAGPALWALALVLTLLPASILSVTLTHWIATQLVPPATLPKVDYGDGIAEGSETAIALPVILRAAEEVPAILDQLEGHWLSAEDPRITVVLLSDPADGSAEAMPGDAALESALTQGIRQLNRRYEGGPFVLLHRHRTWNPAENAWMCWERKRGKLEAFNELIVGTGDLPGGGFPLREGDVARLGAVRYVVTLDVDTLAPLGAIPRLIGTLAHPLNRAGAPVNGRVRTGYTFIQPRVEIAPAAGSRSIFSRLYTGDTAIDIYSRAVSDVYQDLFGEGVFIGKGAYDVAAMHGVLAGAVPTDTLLSHDLFEGLHGRAALATDIVVYEDFPQTYPAFARRMHRWIRGDWQLLPWLAGRVPGRTGIRANPLSALDRWKIMDNLRRSLLPASLVALAAGGWLALPGPAILWTCLAAAAPGAHLFTEVVTGLSRGRRRDTVREWHYQFADHAGRWSLSVAFLANDALVSLDAIGRTLWRRMVSRRHLLEWTSAAHEAGAFGTRAAHWRAMAGSPALALATAALLFLLQPGALPGAAPLLAVWALSPEIAFLLSRPRPAPHDADPLTQADVLWLRRIARRTWLYFETFAGPGDSWLPPDNHQLEPHAETAHRTSPTNIGMLLVSALTARDLGHEGTLDASARLAQAMASLDRIERYRGHLPNWIDTRTLEPLQQRYISTVDSGNLAMSLVTLAVAAREMAGGPALTAALESGLHDLIGILGEDLHDVRDAGAARRLEAAFAALRSAARPGAGRGRAGRILALRDHAWPAFEKALSELADEFEDAQDMAELPVWLERTGHHIDAMAREYAMLAPWLIRLADPPEGLEDAAARLFDLLGPDLGLPGHEVPVAAARKLIAERREGQSQAARDWLDAVLADIRDGIGARSDLRRQLLAIAEQAEALAWGMDFAFLYDSTSRTFFLGYDRNSDRIDRHRYDLLASEARIASYFAIAKGDVPVSHWFHLGRPMARTAGHLIALSWNGSMFEYLMPRLFLKSDRDRLIGASEAGAAAIQRAKGRERKHPWGVSESGYAARDAEHNYQYRAFGVPGLGLRRGLSDDDVVAPYASVLALPVCARAAIDNLRQLETLGARGRYGFFEAVDYTHARRPPSRGFWIVRSFMAHHQGMSLAAIGNALCGDIHVRRTMSDRRLRQAQLLLEERVPREYRPEALPEDRAAPEDPGRRSAPLHGWAQPAADMPQAHVAGNGRLSSWMTDAGTWGLSWHDQSLVRWTGDRTRDDGAGCLYLRDLDSGAVHRIGRRPSGAPKQEAEVQFNPQGMEIHQEIDGIMIHLDTFVAHADDVEVRRVSLSNTSARHRRVELASYGEIVLAGADGHARHPAFSKLFVISERLDAMNAVLFHRRPRRIEDRPPALLHRIVPGAGGFRPAGFDTDRRAFLGRLGSGEAPASLAGPAQGTADVTLDPVMSLRAGATLAPDASAEVAFVTVAAGSVQSVREIAGRYGEATALDWARDDARRASAIEAHRLGLRADDLAAAQPVAGALMFPRAGRAGIDGDLAGQADLWPMGISGDMPLAVMVLPQGGGPGLMVRMARMHRWWARHGLPFDLVILSTGTSGYENPLREALADLMRDLGPAEPAGIAGRVHMVVRDQLAPAQLDALHTLAHLELDGTAETLAEALPARRQTAPMPHFKPMDGSAPAPPPASPGPPPMEHPNGHGSVTGAGYRIDLAPGRHTPAPWCNVLANETFGTIVSEAGLGFTWGGNSGEHRITPWSNDPVTDRPGEAIWLRDEETGAITSATPAPAGGAAAWHILHEPGVTAWQARQHGLDHRLEACVPPDAPVKLMRLTLSDTTGRVRRITATCLAEWVMGALPGPARAQVACGWDAAAYALVARNGWSGEFAGRTAFLTASLPPHSLSCERADVWGRGGTGGHPEGLLRWDLGGRLEDIADPCAAWQVHLTIEPGATAEVTFVLGEGDTPGAARDLAREWSRPGKAAGALAAARAAWSRRLGAVQVATPDPALDTMVNRWLPYQTWASRILARAGFYQAGGAFGFRDQLQDMMALLLSDPARVRAHLLEAAAHQFGEGDVLHWWHPPSGRGVRTRCSDDLAWLAYATGRYVSATGDAGVLEEEVAFLDAPPLTAEEEDRYATFPQVGGASLFEHCRRALERSWTAGPDGLPLIGSGDWNDGMDRVGKEGRGQSVWLGWFLPVCAEAFAGLADRTGDAALAALWRGRAADLRAATDRAAWDGEWYIRARDDAGFPLGAAENRECRIDSIAQSWSVLSGGAPPERAARALASAERYLVDGKARLVRLLAPPFDTTAQDPGYIRGYPPGIRENGGQYTHAAAWLGLAHAARRDGAAAWRIFDLLNPLRRTETREDAETYRAEPYVIAADIGGAPPVTGRAGWTWYTGASGWMWQLAVEGILGISPDAGGLRIAPCLPPDWKRAEARIRTAAGALRIVISDPKGFGSGDVAVTVDGAAVEGAHVGFPADGHEALVEVEITAPAGRP